MGQKRVWDRQKERDRKRAYRARKKQESQESHQGRFVSEEELPDWAKRQLALGINVETFWSRVEFTSSCWLWRGTLNPKGYGLFKLHGTPQKAHRLSWRLLRGEIAEDLHHLCEERSCVNPDHLEEISHSDHRRLHAGTLK